MNAVLRDLGIWFWRLIPNNPILVRVVQSGGRRTRHLWIRVIYLAVLAVVAIFGVLGMQGASSQGSLAEFAKKAADMFKYLSLIQLAMVSILAPVFAASAITQEKDSQTYNILLSTPLTNGQIVLGSLLSRLFFVFALLLASIPLFCIIMVYGGVTGDKIGLSMGLAAATAMLTGSIAISISVIKIGTGRTIFTFYLAIAIYLITVYALGSWSLLIPPEALSAPGRIERMSWLAAFHPFLALNVVLGETPAPDIETVAHYGFIAKYLLAFPQYCYIGLSVVISGVLLATSFGFVRRSALEGEPTLLSRIFRGKAMGAGSAVHEAQDDDDPNQPAVDARSHPPRTVSKNPIAWRESVTSASSTGGKASRIFLMSSGVLVGIVLLIAYLQKWLSIADTRVALFGVVAVEFGITLFVATTAAATSMTREKESNTIELLLATPLTSRDIITGKTWGLVRGAGPMLLVPYLTVMLFVIVDLIGKLGGSGRENVVNPEALLMLPTTFLAFTAFCAMIGLNYSIKNKRTMGAVFTSMGIVIAVIAGLSTCAYSVKGSSDGAALTAAFMPLGPVTSCMISLAPKMALEDTMVTTFGQPTVNYTTCRLVAFISAFVAALIYFLIGIYLRNSMVRSFDMTIRKQMA